MAADTQPDWRSSEIVETYLVADNIRRITIAGPPTARAQPGTHIDVRVDLADRTDIRSYSVVSSNEDGSLITISVLLTPTTRGGSRFMHSLRVGDTMLTTQPLQNFPLRIGAERYVVVAGGIGITAVLAMAAVLKALQADYTFVYAARSASAASYLPELRAAHGDRLVVHLNEDGSSLDVPALIAGVAEGRAPHSTELYMCGPIRLMDEVRRQWLSSQLPIYHLRFETFGNSGWFEPEEFVVRIPRLGLEPPSEPTPPSSRRSPTPGRTSCSTAARVNAACARSTCCRSTGYSTIATCSSSTASAPPAVSCAPACHAQCRARRPVDQKQTLPRHRQPRATSNRPGFPSSPSTSPDQPGHCSKGVCRRHMTLALCFGQLGWTM